MLLLSSQKEAETSSENQATTITTAYSNIANSAIILPENLTTSDFVIVALLILLILISIVGNCLVCVAIFTDRRLRKLGNAFIVSLAIADLFVSCLVMTFALCNDIMQYWIFGEWFCDIWISFDIMCSTASILNLCAISLDRFVHIKDCLLYNQWMTRRVALSAVMIIWFISALVSFVPINLGWHKPDHQWGTSATSSRVSSGQRYVEHSLSATAAGNSSSSSSSSSSSTGDGTTTPTTKLDYLAQTADLTSSDKRQRRRRHSGDGSSGASNGGVQFNQVEFNPQDGSRAKVSGSGKLNLTNRTPRLKPERAADEAKWPPEPSAAASLTFAFDSTTASHPLVPASNHSSGGPSRGAGLLQQQQQLPTCALTLTPTYAIISSTISFYIPCIIMLGLYTKLFACARRHVREIQAISKAPAPLTIPASRSMVQLGATNSLQQQQHQHEPIGSCRLQPAKLGRQVSSDQLMTSKRATNSGHLAGIRPINGSLNGALGTPVRTWLKFSRRRPPAASNAAACADAQSSSDTTNITQINSPVMAAGATTSGSNQGQDHKPINQNPASSEFDHPLSIDTEEQRPFIRQQQLEPTKVNNNNNNNNTIKATIGSNNNKATASSNTKINFVSPRAPTATNSNNQHQHQHHHQQQQQQQQANQVATHKAAVTLGIIMGTFLFCWVPFFCLNIIKALCVDCISGSLFRAFTWLGYANSALNPIIYGIHNSEFRQAFNRIFFKHLNIKNSRYYLSQPVRRFSRTIQQQQQQNNSRLSQRQPLNKSHDDSNT